FAVGREQGCVLIPQLPENQHVVLFPNASHSLQDLKYRSWLAANGLLIAVSHTSEALWVSSRMSSIFSQGFSFFVLFFTTTPLLAVSTRAWTNVSVSYLFLPSTSLS